MTTTTNLRQIGTFEEEPNILGGVCKGELLIDPQGQFWISCIVNEKQQLLPVPEFYAAKYCTSLGIAPTTRGVA